MPRSKLRKFSEIKEFKNVAEPSKVWFKSIKSNWYPQVFTKKQPMVLELAAGYGEFSLALSQLIPEKNFVAVDIKGDRIWKGAKEALDKKIDNCAFLRIQIEHLHEYFEPESVDSIWLTFPDPQPKKPKKRLTSPRFLDIYLKLLKPNGIVKLITDNQALYSYSLQSIEEFRKSYDFGKGSKDLTKTFETHKTTDDLYASSYPEASLGVQTRYQKQFFEKVSGKICFLEASSKHCLTRL